MRWTSPALGAVLLSDWHGLFTWTPLVALAVAGLVPLLRQHRRVGVVVAVSLLVAWYVNAAVADWWAGEAFGSRRFLSCFPLFVLGLSAVVVRFESRLRLLAGILVCLVTLNALLLLQYQVFMKGWRDLAPYPRGWYGLVGRTLRGAVARAGPPVWRMTTLPTAPRLSCTRDALARPGRRVGLLLAAWIALFYVFTAGGSLTTTDAAGDLRAHATNGRARHCRAAGQHAWKRRASGQGRPLLLAIRDRAVGRQRPILPRGPRRGAARSSPGHRRFADESGRRHGQHHRDGGDDLAGLSVRRDAHRLSSRGACPRRYWQAWQHLCGRTASSVSTRRCRRCS